jgi:isopentenyl-diphosphate delta-isomerase
LIFANLGSEASVDQAKRAIDMLEANAIQIHLNVMQELIMPEGDRDFSGMLHRIEQIVKHIQVPVIVKEVGFGIMGESARKLKNIGVTMIDVGGMGGTNFAAIENARRSIPKEWLNDWGGTTATALIESLQIYNRGNVMASGGISNGLEAAKALAIGATAVGMAGTFLRVLQKQGAEALHTYIGELHNELKMIMTAVGAASIQSLWNCPLLIGGTTAEWCQIRGMDTNHYARKGFTETTLTLYTGA